MRWWLPLLGLLCTPGAPGASAIVYDGPLGGLVTTATGELRVPVRVTGARSSAPVRYSVADSDGCILSSGTCADPGNGATRAEIPVPLPRYGVVFVTAETASETTVTRATLTVAAVPDNTRRQVSRSSPFAMGCYFAMRFSPEELKAAARMAAVAGVAFSREELRWDICEPRRGVWDWRRFDRGVDAALGNHIGVMGLLDYWGAYHSGQTTMSAESVRDFCRYARTAVERYRPGGVFSSRQPWGREGVREWEIWNEPATFWSLTPAEFGELTAAACDAIREADAKARPLFANAGP